MRHSTLGLLLAAALTLACPTASAQSPEQTERITRGEQLFELSNFDAALAEFEAVYQELVAEGNASSYILLWNIGQCYERLFQYDRALEYYRRYLAEGGPEAEDRAVVEATMRALEGLLGTVRITTNVADAEVWIDGRQVGTAPGEIHVPGGRHELELRAPGHVPATTEVQLAAREAVDVDLDLEVVSDYRGLEPWLFWSSAGLAVAAAVAGAIPGSMALAESDRVYALPDIERTEEDKVYIDTLALTCDVLLGTAALFGVTAVVLAFLTDWSGRPADAAPSAVALPVLAPDYAGLVVGGLF